MQQKGIISVNMLGIRKRLKRVIHINSVRVLDN